MICSVNTVLVPLVALKGKNNGLAVLDNLLNDMLSLDAAATCFWDPVAGEGGSGVHARVDVVSTRRVSPGRHADEGPGVFRALSAHERAATVALQNK